jgi:hypothetical protein
MVPSRCRLIGVADCNGALPQLAHATIAAAPAQTPQRRMQYSPALFPALIRRRVGTRIWLDLRQLGLGRPEIAHADANER